jgi:hypothetical protein
VAEEGAVKADADDAVRAQRSAARMELPIFIFECDNNQNDRIGYANNNGKLVDLQPSQHVGCRR